MIIRKKEKALVPVKVRARNNASARRPGRPGKDNPGLLNRQVILSLALQMTKNVPLTELSVVRVATELGVTPALIHYYLGSRDGLTSGVMNAFYKDVVGHWPVEIGEWKHDFEVVADALYRAYLRYPGVVSYVATHQRYQLFQDVREGERDYGVLAFEKYIGTIRKMGLDARRTGTYAYLSLEMIAHFSHLTVTHRWPNQSRELLLEKMGNLNPDDCPNLTHIRESFTELGPTDAFTTGLKLMIEAFEVERTVSLSAEDRRQLHSI